MVTEDDDSKIIKQKNKKLKEEIEKYKYQYQDWKKNLLSI